MRHVGHLSAAMALLALAAPPPPEPRRRPMADNDLSGKGVTEADPVAIDPVPLTEIDEHKLKTWNTQGKREMERRRRQMARKAAKP